MSRFVPRLPVCGRFLAVPVLLLLSLAGCAGLAPTDEQRHETDQRNEYAQLVRMGDNICQDGDLTAARALYERAYALDPSKPEPLIGIADAALHTGAMGDGRRGLSPCACDRTTADRAVIWARSSVAGAGTDRFGHGSDHSPSTSQSR